MDTIENFSFLLSYNMLQERIDALKYSNLVDTYPYVVQTAYRDGFLTKDVYQKLLHEYKTIYSHYSHTSQTNPFVKMASYRPYLSYNDERLIQLLEIALCAGRLDGIAESSVISQNELMQDLCSIDKFQDLYIAAALLYAGASFDQVQILIQNEFAQTHRNSYFPILYHHGVRQNIPSALSKFFISRLIEQSSSTHLYADVPILGEHPDNLSLLWDALAWTQKYSAQIIAKVNSLSANSEALSEDQQQRLFRDSFLLAYRLADLNIASSRWIDIIADFYNTEHKHLPEDRIAHNVINYSHYINIINNGKFTPQEQQDIKRLFMSSSQNLLHTLNPQEQKECCLLLSQLFTHDNVVNNIKTLAFEDGQSRPATLSDLACPDISHFISASYLVAKQTGHTFADLKQMFNQNMQQYYKHPRSHSLATELLEMQPYSDIDDIHKRMLADAKWYIASNAADFNTDCLEGLLQCHNHLKDQTIEAFYIAVAKLGPEYISGQDSQRSVQAQIDKYKNIEAFSQPSNIFATRRYQRQFKQAARIISDNEIALLQAQAEQQTNALPENTRQIVKQNIQNINDQAGAIQPDVTPVQYTLACSAIANKLLDLADKFPDDTGKNHSSKDELKQIADLYLKAEAFINQAQSKHLHDEIIEVQTLCELLNDPDKKEQLKQHIQEMEQFIQTPNPEQNLVYQHLETYFRSYQLMLQSAYDQATQAVSQHISRQIAADIEHNVQDTIFEQPTVYWQAGDLVNRQYINNDATQHSDTLSLTQKTFQDYIDTVQQLKNKAEQSLTQCTDCFTTISDPAGTYKQVKHECAAAYYDALEAVRHTEGLDIQEFQQLYAQTDHELKEFVLDMQDTLTSHAKHHSITSRQTDLLLD